MKRTSVDRLLRPCICDIFPYQPGKPVEEVEREYGLKNALKMASNENPLGPSPRVIKALADALCRVNYYPDGGGYYLKEKLASFLKIKPGSLILGNGSDEIIRVITETFLNQGEEAVISDPSFVVYETSVKVMGGKCRIVPLKDFNYDVDGILDAVNDRTKLVFFANPNNPTGTIISRADADRYMEGIPEGVITVFDEAYFEYVESPEFPDSLEYLKQGRPVITLRTFSKIYGLAGLRIGYGITHEEMVGEMNRIRQPFNVNLLAQTAAIAAVGDDEHLRESRRVNKEGKEYLYSELSKMKIDFGPSEANFILIKTGDGKNTAENLLLKGVIVRHMDCYGLFDYIRVTVGRPEDNRKFIEALEQSVEE